MPNLTYDTPGLRGRIQNFEANDASSRITPVICSHPAKQLENTLLPVRSVVVVNGEKGGGMGDDFSRNDNQPSRKSALISWRKYTVIVLRLRIHTHTREFRNEKPSHRERTMAAVMMTR